MAPWVGPNLQIVLARVVGLAAMYAAASSLIGAAALTSATADSAQFTQAP